MFDFETALAGIDFKIRKLIEENNSLKEQLLKSTESNEELKNRKFDVILFNTNNIQ